MEKCRSCAKLFLFFFFFVFSYPLLESVSVRAVTDDFIVTQHVDYDISISSPSDVVMSGAILGLTGGTSNGSATWNIITSNASGFSMSLKASASPALRSGSFSFADYVTGGAPDYNWALTDAASEFGYTVEAATAADLVYNFKDNGSNTCGGAGTLDTPDKRWLGFTTSNVQVINRTSMTSASGEDETVKFRAQSGASHFQEEGENI